MSIPDQSRNEGRQWYLSHEILYIEEVSPIETERLRVWENLILIRAGSPEEAFEKALKHGLDSEDEIRIDGIPGRLKFKGLSDLTVVYDELEDGAEIEWYEKDLSRAELDALIKPRESLHAFNQLWKPDGS